MTSSSTQQAHVMQHDETLSIGAPDNAAMTASPPEAAVASSCELVSSAGAIGTLTRTAP
jgi:hypothetical protein